MKKRVIKCLELSQHQRHSASPLQVTAEIKYASSPIRPSLSLLPTFSPTPSFSSSSSWFLYPFQCPAHPSLPIHSSPTLLSPPALPTRYPKTASHNRKGGFRFLSPPILIFFFLTIPLYSPSLPCLPLPYPPLLRLPSP